MLSDKFKIQENLNPSIQINDIIRSYSSLHSYKKLKEILESYFKKVDFSTFTKFELHMVFNDLMCEVYNGENWIKYLLFNLFEFDNAVSAFEVNANNSRIDFVRINGYSFSYEIKSINDTLQKLEKQINDYNKLFEYNYVVIDLKHYEKCTRMIPYNYGVYIIDSSKLKEEKKALKNANLDPQLQIAQLSIKEIRENFKLLNAQRDQILNLYSPEMVNEIFKQILKVRFEKRFSFLKKYKNQILPIDYQFFFNRNIEPEIIYNY